MYIYGIKMIIDRLKPHPNTPAYPLLRIGFWNLLSSKQRRFLTAASLLPCLVALCFVPSFSAEPSGAQRYLEFEKYLRNVPDYNVSGSIKGALVPTQAEPSGLQIAAYAYASLKRGGFDTVLFFYTAPTLEEEGVIMPESDAIDTPFGSLPVDTALRTPLAQEKGFRVSDSASRWSETVRAHMSFLHKVTRKKRVRVLPLAVATDDWERAKAIPVAVVRALDNSDAGRKKMLVLMAADLSHGFKRSDAVVHDSRLLSRMEQLSAGDMLVYMEEAAKELGPAAFPDAATAVAGILTLNQLLANRGEVLMYANSGQFPVARREDSVHSIGMSSIVFTYGKKRTIKFSKDRTKAIAKHISDSLLTDLLRQARLAIGRAFDPTAETLRSSDDKAAQEDYPVFVSVFRGAQVVGQSGNIEPQGALEEAVRYHAVQAALHDPQKTPLKKEQFAEVVLGVDIPSQPQEVTPAQIIPELDGLVLDYENRRSIFLPDAWKRFPHKCVFASELAAAAGLDPWRWYTKGSVLSAFQCLSIREGEEKGQEEDERRQRDRKKKEEAETDYQFYLR